MSDPRDLDVLATVHRDAFPSRGVYMTARRGLRRQAANDAAEGARSARDEASALKHLADLPVLDADVARRIRRGEATLADALICVRAQTTWGAEAGRVVGAITKLVTVLGRTPEGVPASLAHMERLFAGRNAADFGLQPTAYANLKSRVRRSVKLVDREAATHLKTSCLSGPWRGLMEDTDALESGTAKGARVALWRLVRYCHERDVPPEAVDDAVVHDLLAHLEARGVTDAFGTVRKTVYAWETLQRLVPAWPRQTLSRLYASALHTRPWPAFEDLPPHIQSIWTTYEAAVGRKPTGSLADLVVDDEFPGLDAPPVPGEEGLSPSTLRARRSIWLQAVAVARDAGIDIRSMADVATADIAKNLLSSIGTRQEAAAKTQGRAYSPKNLTRKNAVVTLRMLAAFAGADTTTLEALQRLQDRVHPHLVKVERNPRTGVEKRKYSSKRMGKRHVHVLEQFRVPMTLLTWFRMPDTLIEAGKRLLAKPGRAQEGCGRITSALCHLILRDVPLRRGDLGPLTLAGDDRTLILPPGRGGVARIVLTTAKTGVAIDRPLSERTTAVLRWWITELRPGFVRRLGADPGSPYLFPSAGTAKAYRDEGMLNRHFQRDNQKYGGFRLNLHAMRHLVGKVILDQDPAQIDLICRMLTHENVETTRLYYAEIDEILMQRKIHEILAEAERGLARRSRR